MTSDPEGQSDAPLAGFLSRAEEIRTAVFQREPAKGSVAYAELSLAAAQLGTRAPVERVILCAELWTLVATDQLLGLAVLVNGGKSALAFFPVVRSIIEHATAAVWILEPNASSRVRAARAALALLRSHEESCKAAARMGGKEKDIYQSAKQRLKETREQIAAEFGTFEPETSQVEGLQLARPSEIVEHFGQEWGDGREWLGVYDYLCGTGNHPSMNITEFFEVTSTGTALVLSAEFLNRLMRAAFVPWIKSMEHWVAYMGWSREPLDTYITEGNSVLGEVFR